MDNTINGGFFMKITLLKSKDDKKSFKFLEMLGADVQEIADLEDTDKMIKNLVKNDYTTIIMTNEVASFSESIMTKYKKSSDIKIIIAPPK